MYPQQSHFTANEKLFMKVRVQTKNTSSHNSAGIYKYLYAVIMVSFCYSALASYQENACSALPGCNFFVRR